MFGVRQESDVVLTHAKCLHLRCIQGILGMIVIMFVSAAPPLAVVQCRILKHKSVAVINPQHGRCASAAITARALGGSGRTGVLEVYIKAQNVTLRPSGHLVFLSDPWLIC